MVGIHPARGVDAYFAGNPVAANLLMLLILVAGFPLSFAGAVLGHWILGWDFDALSLFGVIAVFGVVVNDFLVLMDRYNTIRRENPVPPAIAAPDAVPTGWGVPPAPLPDGPLCRCLPWQAEQLHFPSLRRLFRTLPTGGRKVDGGPRPLQTDWMHFFHAAEGIQRQPKPFVGIRFCVDRCGHRLPWTVIGDPRHFVWFSRTRYSGWTCGGCSLMLACEHTDLPGPVRVTIVHTTQDRSRTAPACQGYWV